MMVTEDDVNKKLKELTDHYDKIKNSYRMPEAITSGELDIFITKAKIDLLLWVLGKKK